MNNRQEEILLRVLARVESLEKVILMLDLSKGTDNSNRLAKIDQRLSNIEAGIAGLVTNAEASDQIAFNQLATTQGDQLTGIENRLTAIEANVLTTPTPTPTPTPTATPGAAQGTPPAPTPGS